jgi:hypothetical protein
MLHLFAITDTKVTLRHGKVSGVETSHKIEVDISYNSGLIPTEVSPIPTEVSPIPTEVSPLPTEVSPIPT